MKKILFMIACFAIILTATPFVEAKGGRGGGGRSFSSSSRSFGSSTKTSTTKTSSSASKTWGTTRTATPAKNSARTVNSTRTWGGAKTFGNGGRGAGYGRGYFGGTLGGMYGYPMYHPTFWYYNSYNYFSTMMITSWMFPRPAVVAAAPGTVMAAPVISPFFPLFLILFLPFFIWLLYYLWFGYRFMFWAVISLFFISLLF